jgi:diguanylate cyclase (GGDEF)-like protein
MIKTIPEQTLLIVDDEPGDIKILNELFNSDYKIRVANNGEKALQIALSDDHPDLILLDIMMPGIDGYEVCRKLRADSRTKNIPVIFVTARCDEEDETKGLRMGAVDYVTKPFSPDIVKARVQTHAELKKHRDFLESLSLQDGLTGIANRRRFDEYLVTTWDFATRESSPLSLILIDVDHFKLFNDNYSHQAGDDCLKVIAQALAATLRRKIDLVARYGGEEFACILPKTPLHVAVTIAELFQENILALQIPHAYSSTGSYITISQGVATVMPKKDLSSGMLIKAADNSLYKSKATGRNKITSIDLK